MSLSTFTEIRLSKTRPLSRPPAGKIDIFWDSETDKLRYIDAQGDEFDVSGEPIQDTPQNGTPYMRENGAWVSALPVNTTPPTITGGEYVGSVLTCDPGEWSNHDGTSFTYQWETSADGETGWAEIAEEILAGYEVQAGDEDQYLRCVVTASNLFGGTPLATAATGQIAVPTLLTGLVAHWTLNEAAAATETFVVDGVAENYYIDEGSGNWTGDQQINYFTLNGSNRWEYYDEATDTLIETATTAAVKPWDATWPSLTFSSIVTPSADGIRYDSTAGEFNLTENNGVGSVAGVLGNASEFNGSNYLSSAANPIGGNATAMSMITWLKPENVADWREFVGTWGEASRYLIGVNPYKFASASVTTETGVTHLSSDVDICTDAEWHSVGLRYQGAVAGGTLKVYVDGALAETATGVGAAIVDTDGAFGIGMQGFNAPCIGLVDETAIWNRALSDASFTTLHNGGTPLPFDDYDIN